MIIRKSAAEIETMRRAGQIAARALRVVGEAVVPGVTTGELDALAEDAIRGGGATPAFKGYHGFPASICASVNEEVVHGIPGSRVLRDGDIISVDVGAVFDGYVGDCAMTFPVGAVSEQAQRLMKVTSECLDAAVERCVPGRRLSDISHAVQVHAEAAGFSVVREYVGHGIGRSMHEEPQVPNFGPPGRGPVLAEGMVLAIEPMINAGDHAVESLADGWTVVAKDGLPSAHFEHTIAITSSGPDVLTRISD